MHTEQEDLKKDVSEFKVYEVVLMCSMGCDHYLGRRAEGHAYAATPTTRSDPDTDTVLRFILNTIHVLNSRDSQRFQKWSHEAYTAAAAITISKVPSLRQHTSTGG